MANAEALLPEQCPKGHPGVWIYQQTWEFYSCEYALTNDRNCKWPINKWTPDSEAWGEAESWCTLWKQAWDNA